MRVSEFWRRFVRTAMAGSVGAAVCTLAGCNGLQSESSPRVVTTNLAVLSVTDFETVRHRMQPKFQMDAATALSRSLPTTGASAASELDLARTALKLSLNLAPSADEETSDPEAAPDPSGKAGADNLTGLALPPDLVSLLAAKKDLEFNPALQHQLAQSLVQQVELLNVVVADAAIPAGHVAYVVQLQITALPRKANLDLDLYADIGFFWQGMPSTVEESTKPPPPSEGTYEQRINQLQANLQRSLTDYRKESQPQSQQAAKRDPGNDRRIVKVLPLVGTDLIETFVQGARDQRIRELAAELRVSALQIGAGADVVRRIDELQASIGRRFFSTFSIGRLSENSIRVRLGAQPSGDGKGALVARTHRIPVLLVIPEEFSKQDGAEVLATSSTSLIESASGRKVREIDERALARVAAKSLRPYFGGQIPDRGTLVRLAELVATNDFAGFIDTLKRSSSPEGEPTLASLNPELLWLEVANLINLSQFTGQRFTLPKRVIVPANEFANLVLPVVVEPEKPVVAYVPELRINEQKKDPQKPEVILQQTEVIPQQPISATLNVGGVHWTALEVKPLARGTSLTFPVALGPALKDVEHLSIDLNLPGVGVKQFTCRVTRVEKSKDDAPKLLKMKAVDSITADETGAGELTLTIAASDPEKTKPPFDAVLTVDGASVIEWKVGEIAVKAEEIAVEGGAVIKGPTVVWVKLKNLTPERKVVFELREKKKSGNQLAEKVNVEVRK